MRSNFGRPLGGNIGGFGPGVESCRPFRRYAEHFGEVCTDNTSGGSIAYRSSKAAVNMAMRSAAIDLAPRRITCVVVNPGWVKTDLGGPNATLTPQESVTAMRRLIEKLDPDQSGKFFHYDGSEYPW